MLCLRSNTFAASNLTERASVVPGVVDSHNARGGSLDPLVIHLVIQSQHQRLHESDSSPWTSHYSSPATPLDSPLPASLEAGSSIDKVFLSSEECMCLSAARPSKFISQSH